MNGKSFFNNQFINQTNNQAVNNGNTTPEVHTKKKFFSSAFMENNDLINDVGGTNSSSNNSVVAWSIGNSSNNVLQNTTPLQANVVTNQQETTQPPQRNRFIQIPNDSGTQLSNSSESSAVTTPSVAPSSIVSTQATGVLPVTTGVNGASNNELNNLTSNNMSSLNINNTGVVPVMETTPTTVPIVQPNLGQNSVQQVSNEAIEMLQNVNGTVVVEEPEVLEDFDVPEKFEEIEELDLPEEPEKLEEIEELDLDEPVTTPSSTEVLQDGVSTINTAPPAPVINPPINQNQPSVGVFKPQMNDGNNYDFGYKTEALDNSILSPVKSTGAAGNAVNSGVSALGSLGQQAMSTSNPNVTFQNSAIYQSSQQTAQQQLAPVQTVVDNSPVQEWMTNQPLSASNVEGSTIEKNTVVPANVREEKKKKKEKGSTQPVPEELTKKSVDTNIRPELLVKEYIGEDYQSITMSPFNFGAFLFGAAYFAYRKLFFWATVNLCTVLGLLYFVPMKYNFLAVLGFHVLMALAVNRIYVIHVKIIARLAKRSNQVKKNPKNQEEMEEIMRLRGRVSIINAILAVCIFIASIFFLSMYVLKDNAFSKLVTKSIGGNKISLKKEKFDGTINFDESIDVKELIDIIIPEEFEGNEEKYLDYVYTTSGIGSYNQCSLRIGVVKGYSDAHSYILEVAAYYEEEDKVKEQETKGIKWNNYYTEDEFHIVYYKAVTIDDNVLLLEYKIGKDSAEMICDSYYVSIMESIALKGE